MTWVPRVNKRPDVVLEGRPTGAQGRALRSLVESGDVVLEGTQLWVVMWELKNRITWGEPSTVVQDRGTVVR